MPTLDGRYLSTGTVPSPGLTRGPLSRVAPGGPCLIGLWYVVSDRLIGGRRVASGRKRAIAEAVTVDVSGHRRLGLLSPAVEVRGARGYELLGWFDKSSQGNA